MNVVGNNNAVVSGGELMADMFTYDNPSIVDVSGINNHTLSIGAGFIPGASTLALVDDTPRTLVHLQLKVQDCQAMPNIGFTQIPAMTAGTIYYNGPNPQSSNEFLFDFIAAADVENSDLCGMNISQINPTVINGGTQDTLYIMGSGFGNVEGQVRMRNADVGMDWLTLDDLDVIWSNNLIKIIVPSVILALDNQNENTLQTPGTGQIQIIHSEDVGANDLITSDEVVEVYYSRTTVYDSTNGLSKEPLYLLGTDSVYNDVDLDWGYLLIPDTSISSNFSARACISEAMKDWSCLTNVRWKLDSNASTVGLAADLISTIRFGSMGSTDRVAYTIVSMQRCGGPDGNPMGAALSFDIVMSNTVDWFYDETGILDQPAGSYDFYGLIKHELGHAHLLKHRNFTEDLMYGKSSVFNADSSIPAFQRKIQLSQSNDDGGNSIRIESTEVDRSNCTLYPRNHGFLAYDDCDFTNSRSNNLKKTGISLFSAYPNPFENEVKIDVSGQESLNIYIMVFTTDGRILIPRQLINSQNTLEYVERKMATFKAGMYLVYVSEGDRYDVQRIIKL